MEKMDPGWRRPCDPHRQRLGVPGSLAPPSPWYLNAGTLLLLLFREKPRNHSSSRQLWGGVSPRLSRFRLLLPLFPTRPGHLSSPPPAGARLRPQRASRAPLTRGGVHSGPRVCARRPPPARPLPVVHVSHEPQRGCAFRESRHRALSSISEPSARSPTRSQTLSTPPRNFEGLCGLPFATQAAGNAHCSVKELVISLKLKHLPLYENASGLAGGRACSGFSL